MKPDNESITYFESNYDSLFTEFQQFLRLPSISTDSEHVEDIQKAANFLVKKLTSLGFDNVEAYQTNRHPIVFGEWLKASATAPILLIYGHYDVQPPDPLQEWQTEPFSPTSRGEHLYARGASDMKGQIMASIIAVESVLRTTNLPLNVKFLLEGEEEIGSPSLEAFMETHKSMLKANFVLNPDAGMVSPDRPTIVYGLRGMSYFELRINGPKADLHSGQFGGVVDNPAHVLSKIIAGLHDEAGKVTLPGFYHRVRPLSDTDREKISALNIPDARYLHLTGVPKLYGEAGFSALERIGARPTLDVNGIYSGFIGEGGKTIIPAYAKAKISCRLVPDQDPDEIFESFKQYAKIHVPETVTYKIIKISGAPAYLTDNAPGMDHLINAFEAIWETKVVFKREGGSIPVATSMKNVLGIDSLLTGFGLPDDQIHSPNERLHLPTWQRGIKALILFLQSFSE